MLRMTFGKALREMGYNVIEADSGVKGLALAHQHLPDLVLSDIQMPGGDGTTLLREIRRDPVLKSRQLVLMTGRPDLVTPRKGMEEGADDFLVKPVNLEDLLKCVEARLKRATVSWRVEDERLDQLRSLVPAQLPHELFTPMAGIIGLTEILRSEISTLTPGEVSDILNDLYHSGLRLNRTLRNYLLILDLQDPSGEVFHGSLTPHQAEESIHAGVTGGRAPFFKRRRTGFPPTNDQMKRSKVPYSFCIARNADAFSIVATIFSRLRMMPGSSISAATFFAS